MSCLLPNSACRSSPNAVVGAGIQINIDQATDATDLGATAAAASVMVPVAVFLLAVWALHWSPFRGGRWNQSLAPGCAAAVLLATFSPEPLLATGLMMAALVVASTITARLASGHHAPAQLGADPAAGGELWLSRKKFSRS